MAFGSPLALQREPKSDGERSFVHGDSMTDVDGEFGFNASGWTFVSGPGWLTREGAEEAFGESISRGNNATPKNHF